MQPEHTIFALPDLQYLARFLLVARFPACGLGHLLHRVFDVLPLPVEVILSAVRGHVVVRLRLYPAKKT